MNDLSPNPTCTLSNENLGGEFPHYPEDPSKSSSAAEREVPAEDNASPSNYDPLREEEHAAASGERKKIGKQWPPPAVADDSEYTVAEVTDTG